MIQNKLHAVFIRPNDGTTNLRPCILLTNGWGENFTTLWSNTILFAADLVMRGYAVCIYENMSIDKVLKNPFLAGDYYALNPGSNIQYDADRILAGMEYSGVQLGTAIEQLIISFGVNIIDPNKIYTAGGSYGGVMSLALAYADDISTSGNNNFTNTSFGLGAEAGQSLRMKFGEFGAESNKL